MEEIDILNDIKRILKNIEKKDENEKLNYIIQELNTHITYTNNILNRNGIKRFFEFENSTKFNPQKQEAQAPKITNEKEKDGLVAESIDSGYTWNEKVIVLEKIVRYKYQNK